MSGFLHAAPAPAAIVITDDRDGNVTDYASAAARYRKEGRHVVIDGNGHSACTLALSVQSVCVTPRAVVKFRQAYGIYDHLPRFDITHKILSVVPASIRVVIQSKLQKEYTPETTLLFSSLRQHGIPECPDTSGVTSPAWISTEETSADIDQRLESLASAAVSSPYPSIPVQEVGPVSTPAAPLTIRRIGETQSRPITPGSLLSRALVRVASTPLQYLKSLKPSTIQ